MCPYQWKCLALFKTEGTSSDLSADFFLGEWGQQKHATTDASCTRDTQEARALGKGWAGFPPAPTELWGHTTLTPSPVPHHPTGLGFHTVMGWPTKHTVHPCKRNANFSCREIRGRNQPGQSHSICKMWATLTLRYWSQRPLPFLSCEDDHWMLSVRIQNKNGLLRWLIRMLLFLRKQNTKYSANLQTE